MSKPKLDEQAMSVELGAVAGFAAKMPASKQSTGARADFEHARHRDTTPPHHRETAPAANQDVPERTLGPDLVETVRQAVRHLGKEAATYRFTQGEKRALSQIVFSYKGDGIRTSENELTRIAVNLLLEDYRAKGRRSFLASVLEKLNS